MPTIVQKFGGTSVADPERIRRCARRVIDARNAGNSVVVVVSAMGHTTDELIELAARITAAPSPREMDMLMSTGEQVSVALMAMALHELGCDAVSLTGWQAGMDTDAAHRKARIARATPSSLKAQRSSSEPPPRATIKTSHSARPLAIAIAARNSGTAALPCTAVG